MKENVDYELVPDGDNDHWHVRFLEGEFPETVIKFGAIRIDEDTDELKYSFEIVSSPDSFLTTENASLQTFTGDVLYNIMLELDSKDTDVTKS
jgi:hypothetical protein